MVSGASDVNSSSCYTSSSSSSEEEDGGRHKEKRHTSKNFNGLSCVARGDFCGMARSSGSKKEDLNSDSEEEVSHDTEFLLKENAELNALLDNRDDVLRKTNKEKREYRSLLGESKERVVELESLLASARHEIDLLKAAPIVSDEKECDECMIHLTELCGLKTKYGARLEELDVARAEIDELKSRPALLGACTSCPILHAKPDDACSRVSSLQAALKSPIVCVF